MSRIGNKPIDLPDGIKIEIQSDIVKVEGAKSKLQEPLLDGSQVEVKDGRVLVKRPDDSIQSKVRQGTMRSLILNMIKGVSEGFTKKLLIDGVGFKAAMKGKQLSLNLGYSHPILLDVPEGIAVKIVNPTEVDVQGIEKQKVGFFAAKIRSCYEPEPYKGKGVRYSTETIRRKAGKSVAK